MMDMTQFQNDYTLQLIPTSVLQPLTRKGIDSNEVAPTFERAGKGVIAKLQFSTNVGAERIR